MEVRISIDLSEPPTGLLTVMSPPERPDCVVPFAGWLGLLRALSDAIDSSRAASPGPCGRPGP